MDTTESRYDRLIARARAGATILIDGATGSECTRRGAPASDHGWSGGATLTHPDIVRAIHDDYLGIGADLLASNTFATGRNIMRDVDNDAMFEHVNRQAVEIAVAARDAGARRIIVAGGETSGAVTQALGVTRLEIGTEIAPGVPWTACQSDGSQIALALKSGNFGSETFFTHAQTVLNTP